MAGKHRHPSTIRTYTNSRVPYPEVWSMEPSAGVTKLVDDRSSRRLNLLQYLSRHPTTSINEKRRKPFPSTRSDTVPVESAQSLQIGSQSRAGVGDTADPSLPDTHPSDNIGGHSTPQEPSSKDTTEPQLRHDAPTTYSIPAAVISFRGLPPSDSSPPHDQVAEGPLEVTSISPVPVKALQINPSRGLATNGNGNDSFIDLDWLIHDVEVGSEDQEGHPVGAHEAEIPADLRAVVLPVQENALILKHEISTEVGFRRSDADQARALIRLRTLATPPRENLLEDGEDSDSGERLRRVLASPHQENLAKASSASGEKPSLIHHADQTEGLTRPRSLDPSDPPQKNILRNDNSHTEEELRLDTDRLEALTKLRTLDPPPRGNISMDVTSNADRLINAVQAEMLAKLRSLSSPPQRNILNDGHDSDSDALIYASSDDNDGGQRGSVSDSDQELRRKPVIFEANKDDQARSMDSHHAPLWSLSPLQDENITMNVDNDYDADEDEFFDLNDVSGSDLGSDSEKERHKRHQDADVDAEMASADGMEPEPDPEDENHPLERRRDDPNPEGTSRSAGRNQQRVGATGQRHLSLGDPVLDAHFRNMVDSPAEAPATRQDIAMMVCAVNKNIQAINTTHSHPEQNMRTRNSKRAVKQNFGRHHRAPDRVELSRNVRRLAFQLMKRKKSPGQQIPLIKSATREAVDAYRRNPRSQPGPTLDNFLLDLDSKGRASAWNKRAADIFAEQFIRRGTYECQDEDEVRDAFMSHLTQLKNQYTRYMMGQNKSAELVEQEMRTARLSRRRNLRHRRADICAALQDDESMKRFLPLLDRLPLEAMSGDETDHRGTERRYIITTLPWRSPEIRDWMQVLDDLHLSMRFTNGNRATPGKFPHSRIALRNRKERHVDDPVKGLPRNFYDDDFYSGLDRYARKALRAQQPIDLTFTPEILSLRKTAAP